MPITPNGGGSLGDFAATGNLPGFNPSQDEVATAQGYSPNQPGGDGWGGYVPPAPDSTPEIKPLTDTFERTASQRPGPNGEGGVAPQDPIIDAFAKIVIPSQPSIGSLGGRVTERVGNLSCYEFHYYDLTCGGTTIKFAGGPGWFRGTNKGSNFPCADDTNVNAIHPTLIPGSGDAGSFAVLTSPAGPSAIPDCLDSSNPSGSNTPFSTGPSVIAAPDQQGPKVNQIDPKVPLGASAKIKIKMSEGGPTLVGQIDNTGLSTGGSGGGTGGNTPTFSLIAHKDGPGSVPKFELTANKGPGDRTPINMVPFSPSPSGPTPYNFIPNGEEGSPGLLDPGVPKGGSTPTSNCCNTSNSPLVTAVSTQITGSAPVYYPTPNTALVTTGIACTPCDTPPLQPRIKGSPPDTSTPQPPQNNPKPPPPPQDNSGSSKPSQPPSPPPAPGVSGSIQQLIIIQDDSSQHYVQVIGNNG